MPLTLLLASLLLPAASFAPAVADIRAPQDAHAQTVRVLPSPAVPLTFGQFYDVVPEGFKPSTTLLALNGKRVRMTGYMVNQEEPFPGGFTLCQSPVFCDEEGGGDADIPAKSVRVIVRGLAGHVSPYTRQPLTATGILSVGRDVDADGHVTFIRLLLDRPQDLSPVERAALRASRSASPPKIVPTSKTAPKTAALRPKGDH